MRRILLMLLVALAALSMGSSAWAQTPAPPPPSPTHVPLIVVTPSPVKAPTGPCELGYTCVGPGNCKTPDFWRDDVVCDNATGQLSTRDGLALHGDPGCAGVPGRCFWRVGVYEPQNLPTGNNPPPIGCADREPTGQPECPPYVVCSRQEICDAINADIARRETVERWIGYGVIALLVAVGGLIGFGWLRSRQRS